MRTLRRVQLALVAALLVAVALAVGAAVGSVGAGGIAAAGVVALAAVCDWALGRRVRAWAYSERDDDLVVRRGVMVRRESVVPYGRMQFVDVTAGPFERALGLASVRLHTAAAATDARIPALAAADAARLRDQLSRLGESRMSGL